MYIKAHTYGLPFIGQVSIHDVMTEIKLEHGTFSHRNIHHKIGAFHSWEIYDVALSDEGVDRLIVLLRKRWVFAERMIHRKATFE